MGPQMCLKTRDYRRYKVEAVSLQASGGRFEEREGQALLLIARRAMEKNARSKKVLL